VVQIQQNALDKLSYFQEFKDIVDIVDEDKNIGNAHAEKTFDALVKCNDDMKYLISNAYQMNELAGYIQ
jgi:hypothetical protein